MRGRHRPPAGFTLVELMLVVLVATIFAGMIVTRSEPGIQTRLYSTAQIVAADMARARSLAVTNNSTYRFTFDIPNNDYYLQYSGTNSALSTLPSTAFYTGQDTPQTQYTLLANLPNTSGVVQLYAVGSNGATPGPLTQVEFGAYGQTTQTSETDIWLSSGAGAAQRWLPIQINPVTGLANLGAFQATPPPAAIVSGGS